MLCLFGQPVTLTSPTIAGTTAFVFSVDDNEASTSLPAARSYKADLQPARAELMAGPCQTFNPSVPKPPCPLACQPLTTASKCAWFTKWSSTRPSCVCNLFSSEYLVNRILQTSLLQIYSCCVMHLAVDSGGAYLLHSPAFGKSFLGRLQSPLWDN